ncbi:helix-turn-helix transcriptional regulator [Streptomyces sp. NPDC051940]|uniref:helix-turn-helix domain-containing protein n=1 Tax=Streptomyces sp. NPDC051940 TaxID=3155675 RepID=UPI003424F18D
MTGTGREEFAALLRELKDRSGRSYGALAARLHVSTSTLHRYCNGDAVPTDYAPVERLARLCGATPDELVELHRRWLRADALRRLPSVPQPQDARAAPPAPVPAAGADRLEVEASGSPARRLWRSRRPLLLPSAIGASLVLLLAASAVNSDDNPGGRPEHGGGNIAAPQSPQSTAPSSKAPSPSESPSGASTSASPPGEDKGSPRATVEPRGGTTANPIAWTARSHIWDAGCAHTYLVDKTPAEVPPPPVEQYAESWARTQNAVHGGRTIVEAVLESRDGQPVVIRDVHIRIAGRTDPVAWNAFGMSDGCGGALTEATYTVNLDAERPDPRPQDGFDGENVLPVAKLPYEISKGDPLSVRIEASTQQYDATWTLEIEWSRGEEQGVVTIDDRGVPFRTSSAEGRAMYTFREDGWAKELVE